MNQSLPQGVGLGLRYTHFEDILSKKPQTPWFEVIADDFLNPGPHHNKLKKLREDYPIVFHSVGLNIGGVDPLEKSYLSTFLNLYEEFEPAWISDHLCWSAHNGSFHHDLLPIHKTKESLEIICGRIHIIQDFFKRELCVENITSYIDFKDEEFSELEFISSLIQKTGCKLLLDISNVIINHQNRKEDPLPYFQNFPIEHVKQVHLAGGAWDDDILVDTHGENVEQKDIEALKNLQKQGLKAPAMIERDSNIPDFSILEEERLKIERGLHEV